MKSFDVAIAGDVFCDLIFTGLPGMPEQGAEIYSTDFDMVPGGTYITAVTLRRLGMDVGLFCHLGTDPFSRFVLESMEAEGLDLSLVQRLDYPVKTITVALSFSEDRAFVSYADPRPAEPSPAEALSRFNFRHLHIHWLGQLWEHPGLVELAREQGASVSLDCQCCPETMARPDVFEKLRLVDVFMPNRPEALQVARTTDPEEALLAIAAHAPTAIVKLGENGSIAMREGKRYAFPAMRVPVVDTTGAGDAFAGGFIYGMLSGMSFEESMRAATICGALSTTARGGGTRVPRLPELQDLMRKEW
jgi:sugar/nucleoside kinase (ribokinase family)